MVRYQSPDYEPTLPVSEKSNPLTGDIDRASASGIVGMLQACDGQMFAEDSGDGYQVRTRSGRSNQFQFFWILLTTVLSETLEPTGDRNNGGGRQEGGANSQGILTPPPFCLSVGPDTLAFLLLLYQDPQDSLVVLSGCGTSGRIAFLTSVNILKEARQKRHCFKEFFQK